MSLADRLNRLLFIVPYVADRDGVPVSELARLLHVKPAQIEADIELLSMVGRPPLTPDHLVDLHIEDGVVYVDLHQRLSRPPRLTHEEARALVLGVKLLGQGGELAATLNRVVEGLVAQLNPVDQAIVRALSERVTVAAPGQADKDVAAKLIDAVERHVEIELDYYSASSDRAKVYRLRPLAVVHHTGAEYLVALDTENDNHEKLFRLDRVGQVTLTSTQFAPVDNLDLERFRTPKLYFGQDDTQARVRFSAAVAEQAKERFLGAQMVQENDGSLVVTLSTSSPAFLARWVLPFGTDAEVLEPEAHRAHLAALCRRAEAAYRAG